MIVSHESIRGPDKFGAGFAHQVKAVHRETDTTWHLDEVFVTLRGEPYVLWRAVDQHGIELDILLQKRRDKAAAKRFFERVLAVCRQLPDRIVTDQLRSYPAANRIGEREARIRQGLRAREHSRRKQASARA